MANPQFPGRPSVHTTKGILKKADKLQITPGILLDMLWNDANKNDYPANFVLGRKDSQAEIDKFTAWMKNRRKS